MLAMKAIKHLLLFFQMIFFIPFVFAQNDYKIHLNSIDKTPSSNLSSRTQEQILQGYYIVQFEKNLSEEQKEILSLRGITFEKYIPNYTWILKLNGVSNLSLKENGARFITLYSANHKTNLSVNFEGEQEITILPFDNEQVKLFLDEKKWSYTFSNESFILSVNQKQLDEILNQSSIYFVEDYEGEPTNEGINDSRGNHLESVIQRSNYIGFNPEDDLYFNGQNVTLSVKEGGSINLNDTLNYHNRVTFLDINADVSGHKTGVLFRVGSAGIVNPSEMGAAPAATIYSTNSSLYNKHDIQIETMSYGWGCSSKYNSAASTQDNNMIKNEYFMYSYSAGNSGTKDCEKGFGAKWGNITGDTKMSKNLFTVGSANENDGVYGFSSRGPAYDGRIKPEIVTSGGGGTSHATPSFAGFWGQLQNAYMHYNKGEKAKSSVLKCITLNSADDACNVGPDYIYGWGRINARKAHQIIQADQVIEGSITNTQTKNHTLTIPAGLKQLKVMIYWHDPAAAANVSKALVNDVDMVLKKDGITYLPYSLIGTNSTDVGNAATKKADHLNNMEQIVIDNPTSGNYTINLSGFNIPKGPQKYVISYYFDNGKPEITYPLGANSFNITHDVKIMLDGAEHEATKLFFSTDKNTWKSIGTIAKGKRVFNWKLPTTSSAGKIYLKAENSLGTDILNLPVHFLNTPTNLKKLSRCATSLTLTWDKVEEANKYIVFKLGDKFMEAIDTVDFPQFTYNIPSSQQVFMAVAALKNDGTVSVKTSAFKVTTGITNCVGVLADFYVAKNFINIGDTLFLKDLSINSPTTWNWSSTGGTISNSTTQNPYIIFTQAGIIDISLTVSNGNSSNKLSRKAYITVLPLDNYALSFDGVDEYLQIDQNVDPKGYDEFTLEAWIKPGTGNTGTRGIFGSKYTSAYYAGFMLDIVDNQKIKFGFGPGSWNFTKTTGAILKTNVWQHVALVYNKAQGSISLYVDAVLYNTITVSANAWSKQQVYIGRSNENGGYFKGEMDDVRMWGKSLQRSELGYNQCHEVLNSTNLIFASNFNLFNQNTITDTITQKTATAHNMETSDWGLSDNSNCSIEFIQFVKLSTTYKTCDSLNFSWNTNLKGTGSVALLSNNTSVKTWSIADITRESYSFYLDQEKYALGDYQLKISAQNSQETSSVFQLISGCKTDCNGDVNGTAFLDSCGTCAGGNTKIIPVLDEKECLITAIENTENEVIIYPTILEVGEIIYTSLTNSKFSLYNVLGKLIDSGDVDNSIHTVGWKPGTYVIHLYDEAGNRYQELILVK